MSESRTDLLIHMSARGHVTRVTTDDGRLVCGIQDVTLHHRVGTAPDVTLTIRAPQIVHDRRTPRTDSALPPEIQAPT